MPDLCDDPSAIAATLLARFGRSTLPVQQANSPDGRGTAFWFDEPDGPDAGGRQFLVTADAVTKCDLGELLLRRALCDPPVNADSLLMPGFTDLWIRLDDLGIALMPTDVLHAHAARKGWTWTTDEVDDAVAGREPDLARIGPGPVPVHVLGHGVRPPVPLPTGRNAAADAAEDDLFALTGGGPVTPPDPRERPQTVLASHVARCGDGVVRLLGDVPDGMVGAPVFTAYRGSDGDLKIKCLGLLLPGATHNPVAPFDRIRAALPGTASPVPAPRRRRTRRP